MAMMGSGKNQVADAEASRTFGLPRDYAGELARATWRLYFTRRGRLSRGQFWRAALGAWLVFWLSFALLDGIGFVDLTRIPAALLIFSLIGLCAKRYHDLDRSSLWLTLLLVPVLGVLVVAYELGFRRGSVGENGFGTDPRLLHSLTRDYATVD